MLACVRAVLYVCACVCVMVYACVGVLRWFDCVSVVVRVLSVYVFVRLLVCVVVCLVRCIG